MIPIPLSGTHCLAGRPGNRTACALLAEGGGLDPQRQSRPAGFEPAPARLSGSPSMAERDQHIAPWLQAGATAAADLAALLLQPLQSQ
jgi:hypothetical protein